MSKTNGRWLERLIPLLFVLIFFFVCIGTGGFYFSSNDDSLLTDILSGSYTGTPDAHDIYHLYPLAVLFSVLYGIFPGIPWYGGILVATQYGCIYLVMRRSMELVQNRRGKTVAAVFGLLFSATLLLAEIQMIQYTMTSAILAATAVFLAVTDRKGRPAGAVALYVYACLLRSQMGLLLLPFWFAAAFFRWFCSKEKKRTFILWLSASGALLGCLLLSFLLNALAYGGEDWRAFTEFNQVRTAVYDYGGRLPAYESFPEFYEQLSVSEAEQFLLEKYSFTLSDKWDAERLDAVGQYQRELGAYQYSFRYLLRAVWIVVRQYILFPASAAGRLLAVLAFLFLLLCLSRKKGKVFLPGMGGFLCAHTVCWVYLVWKNRMPERVTNGLYLGEAALLTGMCVWLLFQEKKGNAPESRFLTMGLCGVIALACGILIIGKLPKLREERALTEQWAQKSAAVQEYCEAHAGKLYVLDTISFAPSKERITGGQRAENMMICGAWSANSPLYGQKLNRLLQVESLQAGLSSGKLGFIAEADCDLSWLEKYLSELENCGLVLRDTIVTGTGMDYLVYEFTAEQGNFVD